MGREVKQVGLQPGFVSSKPPGNGYTTQLGLLSSVAC